MVTIVLAVGIARADPTDGVLAVEAARFVAMVDADVVALAPLLAEDLTYGHSTGVVQTKSQFVDAIADGSLDYLSITPAGAQVRRYGRAALVDGQVAVSVKVDGEERQLTLRYTEVYVRTHGDWQLAAWQSTRVAP